MKLKLALLASTIVTGSAAMAQELTVWDWKYSDPVTAAYYDSAREAFEQMHPGVTVNFVAQPHDQYYTLLGTALASGEGPDVVLLHGGSQTTSRGADLADLSGMSEGFSGVDAFSADGATYALPLTIQGFVVYYNRALYEQAGLDPDAPPANWEALTSVCDAIIAEGSVPCFAMGNKEGFGGEFHVTLATANSFTADDYTAWAAGEMPWTDPKARAIVDLWVQMNEGGWFSRGANSTAKFMDEYEMFMRGEAAHTVGLLSDVAHWKQFDDFLMPENLGAFAFPTPGADHAALPFAGGIGWAVTAQSDEQDLAKDLVQILTDGDREAIFAVDTGALPASNAVDTSTLSSPTLSVILTLMQEHPAGMSHAIMNQAVLEEWKRQSQVLLNGDITADEAIEAMELARQSNM
ncbi:ABC transporter substrate-binding protein [Flavimaricola marinus]|uniref:Multiple sugar-binding protein n=1 Tax=Flavimaricola marinus TaxID=1819565 RepID=A0A238LJY0_9RHOB|nr:ABC transporter substrate-binding protein [Flavimaricola marinus]SMY09999.1 Multiple sugar-binding protein precursor [Flavimaricola marinus]